MKILKKSSVVVSILWLALWLITGYSVALGARVAGEEDVTPSRPQASPAVKEPVRSRPSPAARRPPQRNAVNPQQQPSQPNISNAAKDVPKESDPANPNPDTRYVTIDFDNVDIAIFIKFISELTGKNFVIDNNVKGKVTIISPKKISVDEAYKVFESVLEVHGFTTIPAGDIIKIVPSVEARSKDIETRLRRQAVSPEDKVVTQLIPLRYADPNELKKLFAPLISKSSVMVSYPPTGMLIVTDVLSNILRLLKIIEAIDVEGIGEEISVLPLQYATAAEIAKTLNDVFQKRAAGARKGAAALEPTIKIVPDERTNVLVVLASEDDSAKISRLIQILDKETPKGEGDIHVYYLQNANAEDLSKVLTAIPTQGAKTPEKGKAPVISKEVQIVADKATNSLVITAKKKDFLVLEDVIKKLDVTRRMVYIEALLMEVDVNKDFRLGVEWQGAEQIGSHDGRNAYAFGSSRSGDSLDILKSGLSLGVLGEAIEISGISFPSIAAVLHALQTESGVYILETPQIMTTDNEEAQIVIAKNIPYQTRVESTGDVTGRVFSDFEYRDVGVTLNITPQINQERFVRLKIEQEVSQVIQEESVEGLPTTLKRVAKTTVIVKDGNTVVIGGLIAEPMNESTSMTPCLGNITGLGWLFKTVSKHEEKTNLYFFLTPHIVEHPAEAREIYLEKQKELERAKDASNKTSIKMYERGEEKKALEEALKESDDVQLSSLGYQHLQTGEYQKAKEYFQKALEINPENPYAILNMGVIYEVEGNRDEAMKMYKKVIALNPDAKVAESTDQKNSGRALVDIARDNLERLQKQGN